MFRNINQGLYNIVYTIIVNTMNVDYWGAIDQIIRTGHMITDKVAVELKPFGITEPQYNVLRTLRMKRGEPISAQKIQDKMVQRSSNVTRLIDKLQARGLVVRKECPTNRRKMDISITDEGIELLERLDEKVRDIHRPMTDNLTTEEARTLKQLILKLKGQ